MRCAAAIVVLLTLSSVATASDTCASQGEACTDDTSLLSVSPQLHKRGKEAAKTKADVAKKIFWQKIEDIESWIQDEEKKDGVVMSPMLVIGTKISKISAKSLTGILKIAEGLKDQCLGYSKTIPGEISKTHTAQEMAVALEKEVKETVETFLEKWKQMVALHRKLVTDTSKVLAAPAGPTGIADAMTIVGRSADATMRHTMDPIFTLNDNFEAELNKAKESTVGLHSLSVEEMGEHLDELHKHVKRAGFIAKDYTSHLDLVFTWCFSIMDGDDSGLPEQIKPTVDVAFANLRTMGDTIFQDLLSSIRDLASGIQKGIEIAQLERKEETTLTVHNVAVAGAVAIVAAGLVYSYASFNRNKQEHVNIQSVGSL